MARSTRVQPNPAQGFDNKFNSFHDLFNLMLDTTKNREDIKRSWNVISHDIDLIDAKERGRLARNNAN